MIEPIVILNEELIWSDSRELMGGALVGWRVACFAETWVSRCWKSGLIGWWAYGAVGKCARILTVLAKADLFGGFLL